MSILRSSWLLWVSVLHPIVAAPLAAQSSIPTRELITLAVSAPRFGSIERVQGLEAQSALVNDPRQRQLVVLDSTLADQRVVLDSTPRDGLVYTGTTLYRYRGDSSLISAERSQYLRVIDSRGGVGRQFRQTKPDEAPMPLHAFRGFDAQGNAISSGPSVVFGLSAGGPGAFDELSIVRVNVGLFKYEEITGVRFAASDRISGTRDANGAIRVSRTINPFANTDDWTVLSDGTVAVVRGQDYRVELFLPSGKRRTVDLPHARQKLSDVDKQRTCDALRVVLAAEAAANATTPVNTVGSLMTGILSISDDSLKKLKKGGSFLVNSDQNAAVPEVACVPVKQMADVMPPFRAGAAKADADANLWVLTTSTSGLTAGESLYDVVNTEGELFQRVRIPAGRTIVGFGKGGIVFLKRRDADGWILERTRVQH